MNDPAAFGEQGTRGEEMYRSCLCFREEALRQSTRVGAETHAAKEECGSRWAESEHIGEKGATSFFVLRRGV